MAEQIDDYVFTENRGRKSHPWADWLNGKTWRLKRGVDFKAMISSFQAMVSHRAATMGMRARTKIEDDNTIVIQAVPRNGKPE